MLKALVIVVVLVWLIPKLVQLPFGRRKTEYYREIRVLSPTTRLVIGTIIVVFAAVVVHR